MLKKHSRGFTLIELMVATALFASIMVIASGAYLIMIKANREAQSISKGINSVSYALEIMTRNIRTGTDYTDCTPSGTDTISFRDVYTGEVTTYKLESKKIQQKAPTVVDLTDQSVDIGSLMFYCNGTTAGDDYQASVIMIVSGTVPTAGPSQSREFRVQTTATMRALDL